MRIVQALTQALTVRETPATAGGMLPGIIPPPPGAQTLDSRTALTLDGVYRAVDIISTGAAQLSIDVWRNSKRLEGTDVPKYLREPLKGWDMSDLTGELTAALALTGNAYIRVLRSHGEVVGLRPLDPDLCVPVLDPATGKRTVQWNGREWEPGDIVHLRKVRVPGQAYGLGPIQAAAARLSGARDLADWGSRLIRDGGIPTGVLTTDQPLTAEQAAEGARAWNERNSTAGGVAVLGRGLKYTGTAIKPADLQFLESRAYDDRAIARLFGIPAHLMLTGVEGSAMTYQNVASADLSFVRWTLMSYLRPIESALTKIAVNGQTVRFNLDAILRADAATRMATHATAIQAGIYSPAEARVIEGLDPATTPTPTPATQENA